MEISEQAVMLMEALRKIKRTFPHPPLIAGLRASEMAFMFHLFYRQNHHPKGVKTSDISTELSVTLPSVTQMVNQLERQGFAKRTPDDTDRRITRISLTDKGMQIMKRHECEFTGFITELSEYLGKADTDEFLRLIGRVQRFGEMKRQKNNND